MKTLIAFLLVVLATLVGIGTMQKVSESQLPQFGWLPMPAQSFPVEQGTSRQLRFVAATGKSRFEIHANSPIDFDVRQNGKVFCETSQVLETTMECELTAGDTLLTFSDRRAPEDSIIRTAIGALVRDKNTLANVSPATINLRASFWRCVRNCAP